jgi:hypothetical protein
MSDSRTKGSTARPLHAAHPRLIRSRAGIDPDTWTVRLGDSIRGSATYAEYDGAELKIPAELRPDPEYLRIQLQRVLGGR